MNAFDPSNLSQHPEGWQQRKARADWLKTQADEMHKALEKCEHAMAMHNKISDCSWDFGPVHGGALMDAREALAAYQPRDDAGPGGPASEEDSK